MSSRENYRTIHQLIHQLTHGTIEERCRAAEAIGSLARDHNTASSQAMPALVACLDDQSPRVRQSIVEALAFYPGQPEIELALRRARRPLRAPVVARPVAHVAKKPTEPPDGPKVNGSDEPAARRSAVERAERFLSACFRHS